MNRLGRRTATRLPRCADRRQAGAAPKLSAGQYPHSRPGFRFPCRSKENGMKLPAIRRPALATAVLIGLGALVLPRSVPAQMESREGIALQNQILELRRQVQALQQQLAAGGGPTAEASPYPQVIAPGGSNETVAQLVARVGALEESMRSLRGRVEEIANAVRQQGADLSKRIDDLAFQVEHPQAGGGGAGPAPP